MKRKLSLLSFSISVQFLFFSGSFFFSGLTRNILPTTSDTTWEYVCTICPPTRKGKVCARRVGARVVWHVPSRTPESRRARIYLGRAGRKYGAYSHEQQWQQLARWMCLARVTHATHSVCMSEEDDEKEEEEEEE